MEGLVHIDPSGDPFKSFAKTPQTLTNTSVSQTKEFFQEYMASLEKDLIEQQKRLQEAQACLGKSVKNLSDTDSSSGGTVHQQIAQEKVNIYKIKAQIAADQRQLSQFNQRQQISESST